MSPNRLILPALFLAAVVVASGLASSPSTAAPEDAPGTPALNELERKFQETLTGSTFVGRWRLIEDGKLGKEAEDRYSIKAATKDGDHWIIAARIEYGGKDVTFPVPVQVLWAGDTPVITLTKVGIPGLGAFTARVLVYDGAYTGTWSGAGHGGFLSGLIVKESEAKKAPPAEEAKPEAPKK